MFASNVDTHQDVITVVSSGKTVDEAIQDGIAEVTERPGHHADLHFKTFEVVSIQGTIEQSQKGQSGKVNAVQVVLRVFGTHQHCDEK
jgi:flavin-binding protein dodecin